MAVAGLLPSRYYALVGVIAVTVLASMTALFNYAGCFLPAPPGR